MAGSYTQIPRKVGGSRAVGDFRYKLYRAAILQLNKALEQEFYIEAIYHDALDQNHRSGCDIFCGLFGTDYFLL